MLSIDASFIAVFLIVWILVAVLSKVFFKPVLKLISERNARIKADVDGARNSLAVAEQDLQEIEARLKAARSASAVVREAAEAEALKDKARMLDELREDCRAQVLKAKQELGRETARLKEELRSQTELLSEKIEERLLH
ncbi:MAG: ATP synthase F0 subunit B [Candidatus Aminicenantes bacterium]|jgi:F-type H+-transporting ATPase subunit b|nr:ATP synthase F0 subunit B [Candidatus Aminicenantes bacterium]